jgi:hypothetical protein
MSPREHDTRPLERRPVQISTTRTLNTLGTSVTVDELERLIGQARGTDKVSIHVTKGDRPYDSDSVTLTLSTTEKERN